MLKEFQLERERTCCETEIARVEGHHRRATDVRPDQPFCRCDAVAVYDGSRRVLHDKRVVAYFRK